jgi:hypothetical protein
MNSLILRGARTTVNKSSIKKFSIDQIRKNGDYFKSKLSYRFTETGRFRLLGTNIYDRLVTMVDERPNEVAYKFCLTQESFTFKEVKERIDELAQNVLSLGYKRGDKLAVMLPNTREYIFTTLAAASIGVISVLLNPAFQLVEIEYMLKKTKCKGVVILDNLKTLQHYEILTKICPEILHTSNSGGEISSKNLPDLKHVILVHNRLTKDNVKNYKGTLPFAQIEKYNSIKQELPYVDMHDTFSMLFTVIIKQQFLEYAFFFNPKINLRFIKNKVRFDRSTKGNAYFPSCNC